MGGMIISLGDRRPLASPDKVSLRHQVAFYDQSARIQNVAANYRVNDILKPFRGVLDCLAVRQSTQAQSRAQSQVQAEAEAQAQANSAALGVPGQNIRRRTCRSFHIWDRIKESIKSRDNICAEARNLALALVSPITVAEPAPLPNPTQLAKSRSAMARAKTTSSRLKSLEGYLDK